MQVYRDIYATIKFNLIIINYKKLPSNNNYINNKYKP